MRTTCLQYWASFTVVFVACSGSVNTPGTDAGTGGTVAPPYDACSVASDCAWGEIDHEILKSSDCPCLYDCPYLPLSKDTVDRRDAQYQAICTPYHDGQGQVCPPDDCAGTPAIGCNAGTCAAL